MSSSRPLGFFDSGFGGLTIFKKIRQELPQYDLIYLGDNARAPYGNRSFETVYEFTVEAIDLLLGRGCPLVILACNTASAKALRNIQQKWLPLHYPGRKVLGVIRPTVEAISAFTENKKVALWGTTGTVNSGSYPIEVNKLSPEVTIYQKACPLLVPFAEAGETEGPAIEAVVQKYWHQTREMNPEIDTLVLACTHYPILLPIIRKIVPENVSIVSQDRVLLPSLKDYLRRHPEIESLITRNKKVSYLTTESGDYFDAFAGAFLGEIVRSEKVILGDKSAIQNS